MTDRDAANRRLQANVADLVAILLAGRDLAIERHDDGRRILPSLEIADRDGGRVIVHIDVAI